MKINKYQIIVLTWGITVFLGYVFTDLWLAHAERYLASWTVLIAIAIFIQTYLMWLPELKFKTVSLIWIAISWIGGIATYAALFGKLDVSSINIHAFWLGICAAGMFGTAIALKNNISYYILGICYLLPAVYFQLNNSFIDNDLYYVGLIFLVVEIFDALLEYSSFRKNLADFDSERVL